MCRAMGVKGLTYHIEFSYWTYLLVAVIYESFEVSILGKKLFPEYCFIVFRCGFEHSCFCRDDYVSQALRGNSEEIRRL